MTKDERIAQLERALAEMLKYGEHEGPCDNMPFRAEPCQLHLDASDKRKTAAQEVLAAKSTYPRLMRVRRLVEYVGEADSVLAQLRHSLAVGEHNFPKGRAHYSEGKIRITVSQLGPVEMVDGDDGVTVAERANALAKEQP